MRARLFSILALLIVSAGLSIEADAQATRTWVSGVGDDVNPCSRTAPCKTFAGAISKTAAGGEIDAMDPGSFGAVTITKSITIAGDATLAGITTSGVNGISINANATTDTIILRNLSIGSSGVSPGLDGIRYVSASHVVVENVTIYGMSTSGIEVIMGSNSGTLLVRNTNITGGPTGIKLTSGNVNASLSNVSLRDGTTGIDALSGTVDVDHSVIAQNSSFGAIAEGGSITLQSSMLTGNSVAIQAATGSTLRISGSGVYNNLTAIGCGGGTIATSGDNQEGGNTGGSASCTPNNYVNTF